MNLTRFGPWICVLGFCGAPSVQAVSEAPWLDARRLGTAELRQQITASRDASSRVVARLMLADRAINQSVERATSYLEQAEDELNAGADADAADIARAIRCQVEHRQGLRSLACDAVLSRATPSDNVFVAAYDLATTTYVHYREGRHDLSLPVAEALLETADYIDDPGLQAAAHNMIGLHFATRMLPRMALPHLETALDHAREMAYPEYLTVVYLNLASSYTFLGRAAEALQMLEEARASPVVDLYPTRRLVVQSMIAQAQVASGTLRNAESELRAVIDDVKDTALGDAMTFGYTGLGVVLLADGRPGAALVEFDRVLEITGQTLKDGLSHPRVQLMVVYYAAALRDAGRLIEARELLEAVVATTPADRPDQLLVDATKGLSLTHAALGDDGAARAMSEAAVRLESRLWDASFQYQVARLNASVNSDRKALQLERAQEREIA